MAPHGEEPTRTLSEHQRFPAVLGRPNGLARVVELTQRRQLGRLAGRGVRARDLSLELRRTDLPLGSPAGRYRALADEMLEDRSVLGLVITSHKRAMYEAVSDLVVASDPYARAGREVSPLLATDCGLAADACDPRAVRLVLGELLGPRHWEDTAAD